MGGVLGGSKSPKPPKAPEAPPPLPKVTDNSALEAARLEQTKLRRRSTALAFEGDLAKEPNKAKKTALGV